MPPLKALLVKGTVGGGTSSPSASAALEIFSTNSGILIPRMKMAQRNLISSAAEGLMVMCSNCGSGGVAELTFYSSGSWNTIPKQPQWTCGMPITKNHTAGDVAPVAKTTTYGTVTGIPGEAAKCWISSISGSSDWLTANDPCNLELGTQWRVPTSTEWYNIDNTGGWTNWNGPWGSGLKLHAAAYLDYSNGLLAPRGSDGNYWSSTQDSSTNGWRLGFSSGASSIFSNNKAYGMCLRCLRD